MPNEFIVKNGLVVGGNVVTSGTITINGALAATQSWVTSQAYLTSASLSGYATQSYVTSAISSLIDAAPAALDTLNELAAALGDDANFSTTITNSIASKQAQLNGTGLVRMSGTSVSYDNTTYLISNFGNIEGDHTYGYPSSNGWYKIAEVVFNGACQSYNLWGEYRDTGYFDNSHYRIHITARAECDFPTNNESHAINVNIYGSSTNETYFSNNVRVVLTSSSSNYRKYELQYYRETWDTGSWNLQTLGWTTYTTSQTAGTPTGTPRVYYVSKFSTDNIFVANKISIGTSYSGFAANIAGTTYIIGGDLFLSDGYTVRNASNNSSIAFNTSALSFTGAATFSSTIASGGNINVGSQLTFTPNEARIISGSSTFAINNNANNTNLLLINNSTGNVGIGTSSPGYKLDVQGSAGNITINTNGLLSAGGQIISGTGEFASSSSGTDLNFRAGATHLMVLKTSGNVGIGTTTPQKKLDVFGSAGIVASIGSNISPGQFAGLHFGYSESYANNDSYKKSALVFERTDSHGQGSNASGKIHFLLNNMSGTSANALTDSVVTIDSDANGTAGSVRMGIGTRNPSSALEVIGTIRNKNASVNSNYSQLSTTEATLTLSTYSINTGSYPANIIFSPASTEAMRINTVGKVSIGTTDTNSDKSDFTVYTGGNTSIALAGNLFRVGESDINWDIALRQNGTLQTYGQALNLNTQAGNYAVNVQPNGVTSAQFYQSETYINTYAKINYNWGGGTYGTEAFTIRGTYPSLTLRSTNADNKWLFHNDGSGDLRFYQGSGVDTNSWTNYITFNRSGQIDAIGGNSSQWNTAYGWGNHASAGYVTSSGSVSYATTAGALTSMNISQFTNNSGYVAYGNYSWTSPVFGQYGIKSNLIDNVLYSAADRFEVFKDGSPWNTNTPFNLNYDQSCDVIPTSTSRTYSIILNTKGNPSYGIVYTEGNIYLSFYYVYIPGSVSGRVRFQNGTWVVMSGWTNVSNNGSLAVWRSNVPGGNYMVEIEITINANSSNDTWFAQWEYVMGRPGQYELGIINKAQDNSLWRNMYFRDSSNNVQVSIGASGLSTSQNLNISGTSGLTFGSYGGGFYMQDSSWIRTVNYKSIWTQTGLLGTDGGLTVGYGGNTPPSGGAIIAGTVGIGTSSPSYKLDVNGTGRYAGVLTVDTDILTRTKLQISNGRLFELIGSSTALNIYDSSAGASRLYITDGGNIGVGTTNPGTKLHVVGNAWINRPTNKVDNASCTELPSRVEFNNAFTAGSTGYTVFTYPTSSVFRIYGDYDGNVGGVQPDLQLGLGYLTVKNSGGTIGNIGIGTTSPQAKLHVVGNTYIQSGVLFVDTIAGYATNKVSLSASTNFFLPSGNIGIKALNSTASLSLGTSSYDNNPLAGLEYSQVTGGGRLDLKVQTWGTGSNYGLTTGLSVLTPGFDTADVRVGIGTTSPATPLHVTGGATGTGGWNRTATLAATYPGLIFNSNGTKWGGMAYDYSAAMRFWVNANNDDIFAGTQAMSILNNGNVGIGTSNPIYKLQVAGSAYVNGGTLFIDSGEYLRWGNSNQGIVGVNDSHVAIVSGGATRQTIYAEGRTYFPGLDLSISNINGSHGSGTYFRGDGGHFVFGLSSGNTLYLNYGNSAGILRTFGTWYHESTQILSTSRVLTNVSGNISMFTNDAGYLTSVSDIWVNTAGDTMTGALTIQGGWASTILDGDNVVLRKPNYSSGGWARTLLNFQEYDTTSLFQIGGYGSNNTMTYGYLGSAYNTPTIKWYANKNVAFSGNIIIDDAADNNRYQKGGSFLNLRDPWDNIHFSNNGGGIYVDSPIHYWRSASGSTYWMTLVSNCLGIGTTNPVTKLHAVGTSTTELRLQNADANNNYGFVKYETSVAGVGGNLVIGTNASGGGYGAIGFSNNNNVEFAGNGDLYVVKSGNVGIGTYSPTEKLHVAGRIMAAGSGYTLNPTAPIFGQYSSTRGYIQVPSNGQFEIWTGGTAEIATFYNNQNAAFFGNVGIGTTSPAEKFHVLGRGIFDGGSGDSSTDAVLYVTKSNNNDWGLYVNAAALDYGMYARVSPSAGYAIAVNNGTSWTTRITGNAVIYLGEKNAIEGNSDSWLRLNNQNHYASGVYTPGVMRADGGFNVSGSTVWHAGNDGSGSGLDADTVDGLQASVFVRNDTYNSADAGLQVFRNIGTIDGSWPSSDHTFGLENSDAGNIVINFHRGGYTSNNLRYNGSQFRFDAALESTGIITATGGNSTNWNTAYGWGNHASYSYATTSYVTTQINNLIAGAPGALDTLDELAAALGDDASFATTVTNSIAAKLPLAGGTMSGSINMNGNNVINIGQVNATHAIFTNDGSSRVMYLRGSGNIIQFQNAAATDKWEIVGRDGEFYVYKSDGAGSGYKWRIDGVGNHTITGNLTVAGTITESSSIKLKENVKTSEGNLEKVVNLRPVTYNKIGSQTTELGLIAEEVAEVYPEFVQYDENGEPIGVHYSRLTAALIGAVKELTQRIETLENNG